MPTATRTRKTNPKPRSKRSTNSPSAANPSELDIFAAFCRDTLTLADGRALRVEDFQRRMLAEFFDGIRESLILLSKKNGKSTLLAALGLFHLLSTPDADCIAVAASREQADIILKAARGFVRRSSVLQERLTVKLREIEYPELGGVMKIRASDVDTVDGWIGTLGFIDELHRHKSSDLYGIIRDGLGPLQGQMVTISTAGDDRESPLGQLRAAAYAQPGLERDGAHRFVRTAEFVMHEWALDPDQNRDDLTIVKQANPASWQTIEELRKRQTSPSMKPWQWARFACGVWLSGEEGAFSEREWRECESKLRIPDGREPIIGIDLGWRWDSSGVIPVWDDGEHLVVAEPTIIASPQDGSAADAEVIRDVLREMAGRWPKAVAVLDPAADGEQLAQWIEAELGWRVIVHSQKPVPMALAAQRLSEAIASRRLRHPGDPELTRHVLAAAAKPVGEGWRLVKSKRNKSPIDGAVALAMGVSMALNEKANPADYRIDFL